MNILDNTTLELLKSAVKSNMDFYGVNNYLCEYHRSSTSDNDFLCLFGNDVTFSASKFKVSSGYKCSLIFHTSDDDTYTTHTSSGTLNCTLKAVPNSFSLTYNSKYIYFTNSYAGQSYLMGIDILSSNSNVVSGESTPLDFTSLIPYFVTIIAVLMLIFMTNFIKSCFKRRS